MVAFCTIIYRIVQNGGAWGEPTIIYIPISSLMIWLFAVNKGAISKVFTNKLLIFIGNMSGYSFLIHQIVLRYLNSILKHIHFISYNFYCSLMIKIIAGFMITTLLAKGLKQIDQNIIEKHID